MEALFIINLKFSIMNKFFDFSTLRNTDWSKPNFEKSALWIVAALATVMMVIAPFTSWATVELEVEGRMIVDYHQIGVSTWYGVLALIAAIATVVAILYRHYNLAVLAAAFAFLMGFVGMLCYEPDTVTLNWGWSKGTLTFDEFLKFLDNSVKGGREVAIYSPASALSMMLYSAISGVCGFMLYKRSK